EIEEAVKGEEVAIAVDGGVIGRNIKEDSVLYSNASRKAIIGISDFDLGEEDWKILEEIEKIKNKNEVEKKFNEV
ncbi:MAG: translation initiation factor IF-2, partial [Candidatus Diapherotrites archaeon]